MWEAKREFNKIATWVGWWLNSMVSHLTIELELKRLIRLKKWTRARKMCMEKFCDVCGSEDHLISTKINHLKSDVPSSLASSNESYRAHKHLFINAEETNFSPSKLIRKGGKSTLCFYWLDISHCKLIVFDHFQYKHVVTAPKNYARLLSF